MYVYMSFHRGHLHTDASTRVYTCDSILRAMPLACVHVSATAMRYSSLARGLSDKA